METSNSHLVKERTKLTLTVPHRSVAGGAPWFGEKQKAEPQRHESVREMISKRFEHMADKAMRGNPELSRYKALDQAMMSDVGRRLYDVYSDPRADRPYAEFLDSLRGESEEYRRGVLKTLTRDL
jgi:hypothetical protein